MSNDYLNFNIYCKDNESENENKIIDLNKKKEIKSKVKLSNETINNLRENFQIIIDSPMRFVEFFTKDKFIDEFIKQEILNNLSNKIFCEIKSDWTYENINLNRGFTSQSIWMRNSINQRILIKIEDHPLSAINEWLSYQLGSYLHLPINHVQISIYQNKLVTLHKDVKLNNEQIYEFIHLPKNIQKIILKDPIILLMDLFDHFINNCDRNPRNILITIPIYSNINHIKQFKIHFIDHSSSFGLGKLNLLSAIALKLHSKHFSIVKFNPSKQAKLFEKYLYQIPIQDHIHIKQILNRFATIDDQLIHLWFQQIKNLLSIHQYNRIITTFQKQILVIKHFIEHFKLLNHFSNE